MKEITHNGEVYQIGALYEFSDLGKSWHLEVLGNICGNGFFEVNSHDNAEPDTGSWRLCRNVNGTLGTIEDAPLKLEDGEWYMCDNGTVGGVVLKFIKADGKLVDIWFDGTTRRAVSSSQEKPLYKMVKGG